LDQTGLTSLPESFIMLPQLQRLSLAGMYSAVCPEAVGQLLGLTWLCLRENRFTQLPESLNGLSCLRELDVRYCFFLWWLPASLRKGGRPWLHMVRCCSCRRLFGMHLVIDSSSTASSTSRSTASITGHFLTARSGAYNVCSLKKNRRCPLGQFGTLFADTR
jgi:hypothetical protein